MPTVRRHGHHFVPFPNNRACLTILPFCPVLFGFRNKTRFPLDFQPREEENSARPFIPYSYGSYRTQIERQSSFYSSSIVDRNDGRNCHGCGSQLPETRNQSGAIAAPPSAPPRSLLCAGGLTRRFRRSRFRLLRNLPE